LGKRFVFILLPEVFCGLKYAENAIVAISHPTRRLWRLDVHAFGASIVVPPDTKSWQRHWSPPLFKVKLCQWYEEKKKMVFERWLSNIDVLEAVGQGV